jgi:hypothetical protein
MLSRILRRVVGLKVPKVRKAFQDACGRNHTDFLDSELRVRDLLCTTTSA